MEDQPTQSEPDAPRPETEPETEPTERIRGGHSPGRGESKDRRLSEEAETK